MLTFFYGLIFLWNIGPKVFKTVDFRDVVCTNVIFNILNREPTAIYIGDGQKLVYVVNFIEPF